MRRALVGSDRLGSGCLVLRADTRENPGGKNGVMTVVTQADSYPNHKFRFETWEITQADSSPV
jgi:hypothetical protein